MLLEDRTVRKMKAASIKCALALPLVAGILLPSYQSSDASITGKFVKYIVPSILAPNQDPAVPLQEKRLDCPSSMNKISTFCMDVYEAHLVVDGAVHPHNTRPPSGKSFRAETSPGVFPQGYISRDEASAACAAAGKRLCALSEWLEACAGAKKQLFPYGNKYDPQRCNTGKQHLLSILFKDQGPEKWKYDEHFNSPALNAEPGFLSRTGEYADCMSTHGISDMAGNLHEWVSDNVDSTLEMKINLIEPIRKKLRANSGHGIFMGGFYSTIHQHGYGCGFITIGHEPSYHDYSTGFRCCTDS